MKVDIATNGAERAAAMFAVYSTGATLQEVGERYGVSRERVRQILKAHDYPVRSVQETAALHRAGELAIASQIVTLHGQLGDPREVADRLGVTYAAVQDVLRAHEMANPQPASIRRRKLGRSQKRYTDEELLKCIEMASKKLGGVLTTNAYTEFIRGRTLGDGRPWPSHQCMQLRFGSWRGTLQRAGLRANPASAIAGQRLFEAGHCVDAIRHVAREVGHSPTAAEYDVMARASDGGLPSLPTVRNRLGGWLNALDAAGY
jgi:predicted transcriptional regulator